MMNPRHPITVAVSLTTICARVIAASRPSSFTLVSPRRYPPGSLSRSRRLALSSSNQSNNGSRFTVLDPAPTFSGGGGTRDLEAALRIAEEAALRAGEIMRRTAGRVAVADTKANRRDLVTEIDVECQRVIENVISKAFPRDRFLGEEDVAAGSEASVSALRKLLDTSSSEESEESLVWVVDPIDGTTNFQAGLPLFSASIGVVSLSNNSRQKPEVVVGVIYNPVLSEMISAVRGRGCYLNGKRLGGNSKERGGVKLSEALVNVGFPVVKESTLLVSSRAVAALATRVRGLRMIASASQVISWVAQSKLNAYISWDLNAWDVAAGMIILEESGGKVHNMNGAVADILCRDLIFTCDEGERGILCDQLREVLIENDCISY